MGGDQNVLPTTEESIDDIVADALSQEAEALAVPEDDVTFQASFDLENLTQLEGNVVPTRKTVDFETLCEKFGGYDSLMEDHRRCLQEGLIDEDSIPEVENFYEVVKNYSATVKESRVVFEHESGGRLVLLGTSHMSRQSSDLTRDTVREERPECLVMERRLGDDSLQRLTIPEELYQDIAMKNPTELLDTDDHEARVAKFYEEHHWLSSFPGWMNIGGQAARAQEFGAAFEEFARQRAEEPEGTDFGPLGGTVCFADGDLRSAVARDYMEVNLKPSLQHYGQDDASMPLRDLSLASGMRLALKTHKRTVGVTGRNHLAGITRLLKQDPRIKVVEEGIPLGQPVWVKDLQDGGKRWERAGRALNSLFSRMSQFSEEYPFGTFMSGEAVRRLYAYRKETEARLLRDGVNATPASPVSSWLGMELMDAGLALTPKTEEEFERWLAGERIVREAGEFPFENLEMRKATERAAKAGKLKTDPQLVG